MRTYIIRRLLLLIPTLFFVSIIVFLSVRLIPGDVITMMSSQSGSGFGVGVNREALEREFGLDVPWYVQYVRWMAGVFRGELGESFRGQSPVTDEILPRLPVTLELGFFAMLISVITALPVGIYSAIRQDTLGDYMGRGIAIVFISVPLFWTATMVMIYPALWWGWAPPLELIPFERDPLGHLGMFIIPAIVMGLFLSGTTIRMTRTMMLEVLRQDYIRTAWSKGLTERAVVIGHAMKNSLIPVVTAIGTLMPYVIGGAVIVEQIFALPGIGQFMLEAITYRDYPVVSAINLITATLVVLINLLVDLTYAYLDPRIRYR